MINCFEAQNKAESRSIHQNVDYFNLLQKQNKKFLMVINLKVTPTTFYEITKISHICSIFRKSTCIRVVHIF